MAFVFNDAFCRRCLSVQQEVLSLKNTPISLTLSVEEVEFFAENAMVMVYSCTFVTQIKTCRKGTRGKNIKYRNSFHAHENIKTS